MSWYDPLFGFAVGVAATLVAGYLWGRFRETHATAERPVFPAPADPPPVAPSNAAPAPGSPAPGGSGDGVISRPSRSSRTAPGRPTLVLSERIVLHLDRYDRSPFDGLAPLELCQQGMVERLGVTQSALTKVLQRLAAAQVLVETTEHVAGQSRRRKVYRLSTVGRLLAKDIRRRAPTARAVTGPPGAPEKE